MNGSIPNLNVSSVLYGDINQGFLLAAQNSVVGIEQLNGQNPILDALTLVNDTVEVNPNVVLNEDSEEDTIYQEQESIYIEKKDSQSPDRTDSSSDSTSSDFYTSDDEEEISDEHPNVVLNKDPEEDIIYQEQESIYIEKKDSQSPDRTDSSSDSTSSASYISDEEDEISDNDEDFFSLSPTSRKNLEDVNIFNAIVSGDLDRLNKILSPNNLYDVNRIFRIAQNDTNLLALAIGSKKWPILDVLLKCRGIRIDTLTLAAINALVKNKDTNVDISKYKDNLTLAKINSLLKEADITQYYECIDDLNLKKMYALLKSEDIMKNTLYYIRNLRYETKSVLDFFIKLANDRKSPYILWFILNKYFSMNLDRDFLDSDKSNEEKYEFYAMLLSNELSPTFNLK